MSNTGGGAASDLGSAAAAAVDANAWAPLRNRTFRWLWLGVLVSGIGFWMQTVGAQWLLVDAPNAAALVAMVQAANSLPIMLLALPGGVLADSFDRRWLLFTVQVYFFVTGLVLAGLAAAGYLPPALLLTFIVAHRRRRGRPAPDVAVDGARAGVAGRDPGGVPARPGQRQRLPRGRARAGGCRHRPSGRRAGGLRALRLLRRLPRRRPAAVAPRAGPAREQPGAVRPRPAGRQPVRVARAGGPPHHAPPGSVRAARRRAVGPVAGHRQPAARAQRRRLRRPVRRARDGRHRRRAGPRPGQGTALGQRHARRRRSALRGRAGRAGHGGQLPRGAGHPGGQRPGLDDHDLDPPGRDAADPAGLGPGPWPRPLHRRLHGLPDRRRPALGAGRQPGRPAARRAGRRRRRPPRRARRTGPAGARTPAISTRRPSSTGPTPRSPTNHPPTPGPSWSPYGSPSPRIANPSSWRPWTSSAGPGSAPAPPAGSCTATPSAPPSSSRPSGSRRGRSTSASTPAG